jgi:hypothetical protein
LPRTIESLFVEGPAGRLEAMIEEPADREPVEAALVCHPHPLHGGTMHNKVVHRLARGLRTSGAAVLRFNFRGVNLSAGEYDHGRGEVDDARACLKSLRERYPGLPFTVAGFSFGSRVAVTLAGQLPEPGAARVILAGFPTVYKHSEILDRCRKKRIFLQSTNDEFGPREELLRVYEDLWGPKEIHWIEARDHFFAGALDEFERAIALLGSPASP